MKFINSIQNFIVAALNALNDYMIEKSSFVGEAKLNSEIDSIVARRKGIENGDSIRSTDLIRANAQEVRDALYKRAGA